MEAIAGNTRLESPLTPRFSLREASRILEVPEGRLRALARAGFLAPQRGPIGPLSFGFHDLLLLRTTRMLVESGVSMRRIRNTWASLRAHLEAGRSLSDMRIEADGEDVVATDGSARWRPDSGQFILDFESDGTVARPEPPAPIERHRIVAGPRASVVQAMDLGPPPALERSLPMERTATLAPVLRLVRSPAMSVETDTPDASPPSHISASDWYEIACDLEATDPAEAIKAYERALDVDPDMSEAHINLGRLLHLSGEHGRAEPHYREAVRIDPDDPSPHFNIGVLLEEAGRREEAILAYRQAILRDPDFADAHCNLGLLLESMGRKQEAMRHLMAARSGSE